MSNLGSEGSKQRVFLDRNEQYRMHRKGWDTVWDDSETCGLGYLPLFCVLSNRYEIYYTWNKWASFLWDRRYPGNVLSVSYLIIFYHEIQTCGTTEELTTFYIYLPRVSF